MHKRLILPYGDRALAAPKPPDTRVVEPPPAPPSEPVSTLLERALDEPVESRSLEDLAARAQRVLVVVSDDTRDDPREELLRAVFRRLPRGLAPAVIVASGTHAPRDRPRLTSDEALLEGCRVVVHDGRDRGELVDLGQTSRGTPVRLSRLALEADLVVATGLIKPHYFAGFGAGAKAIFPGLGGAREIRINHRLKGEAGANAGSVENNPCRLDLEEAARALPRPVFTLNAVADPEGAYQAAVAGDMIHAFRAGARVCDRLCRVRAPAADALIASDALPVTKDLYQASKIVAAAAPLAAPGATIVLAAQCPDGIGPVETVNQGIYEIGLKPRLPPDHRIRLVSDLSPEEVARTYCEYSPSIAAAVADLPGPVVAIPKASALIVDAEDAP